ncbi:hypothetical protein O3P69_012022 [Scylla paramamosain]|uniref:Uncharacterized protein n=1 Tax=Scylla paramamosain TaxID=85552 RepID=A0AAW0SC28_SCYPA
MANIPEVCDGHTLSQDGLTPLHAAALCGAPSAAVEALLRRGVSPHVTTPDNMTPADLARQQGQDSVIKGLQRHHCVQEPEVEEVVAYFESNYIRGMQIGGRRRDPRFPIKLWNHFEDAEECAPKTTNCCEGFHNALKSVYMCAPNHVEVSEGHRSGHRCPASSAPECVSTSARCTH